MKSFTTVRGIAALMDRANVDTDQIIPKQFLKRIERTGFGRFLFYDWRFDAQENPNPAFELNRPEYLGASILVAKDNFGCGSSREHAVWALDDFGIRCVIAPNFADIFYNNCFKNGVLPVALGREKTQELFDLLGRKPQEVTVDLHRQTVTADGFIAAFEIDPFRKECLLHGLDDIGLTLQWEDKIQAFESARQLAHNYR
ncbi:MAG: 3-isopropylmalate dehydratase small subunit [Planctomycetaceae bacterium]|nr:3-isopropylmalate dehydratase small subunit [Planctomycetaceae bacterium]